MLPRAEFPQDRDESEQGIGGGVCGKILRLPRLTHEHSKPMASSAEMPRLTPLVWGNIISNHGAACSKVVAHPRAGGVDAGPGSAARSEASDAAPKLAQGG